MTRIDLIDLTLHRPHLAIGPLNDRWEEGARILIHPQSAQEGSAFFRLLTGLLAPTYGVVLVDGRDMRRNRVDCLRSMGILFETPFWHAGATLRENVVRLGGRLHSFDAGYADELAVEVGLGDCWNRAEGARSPVAARLANMVLAASHHPDLLLLENPFSHLSGNQVAQLGSTLREIHRLEDTTIVIVQCDGVGAPTFPMGRIELADGAFQRPRDRGAAAESAAS